MLGDIDNRAVRSYVFTLAAKHPRTYGLICLGLGAIGAWLIRGAF